MRASSDRIAADLGGVRASDAERDQAIGELRDGFIEGRLSQETFIYRMDAALRAKDRAELAGLFADLPHPADQPGPAKPDRAGGHPEESDLGQHDLARHQPAPGEARPHRLGQLALGRLAQARLIAGRRLALVRPRRLCLPPDSDQQRIFTIGRELACDFTLADQSVSRWHARLHQEDGRWLLCDLGSTNGTRLNGWRVTGSVRVRPGDRISFGAVSFVLTGSAVS